MAEFLADVNRKERSAATGTKKDRIMAAQNRDEGHRSGLMILSWLRQNV